MSVLSAVESAVAYFFAVMFHPFVMMWAGQALHMLRTLKTLETEGQIMSPREYVRKHPYSFWFSVIGGFIVYGFLYTSGQITVVGAFTAGYMADSMISVFTEKEMRWVAKDKERSEDKN